MKRVNGWHHFKTITEHKILVMKYCFRVGLYRQGLLHDLSKYAPAEFLTGVRYYQGNRSPNAAEREEKGYSAAWLRHKGRNKHHFEYWIDFSKESMGLSGGKMPLPYLVEMIMDRIAASRVYRRQDYTDGAAWEYYQREQPYLKSAMHPETQAFLENMLLMLKEHGEAVTFACLRELLKKGTYGSDGNKEHTETEGALCLVAGSFIKTEDLDVRRSGGIDHQSGDFD